MMGMVQRLTAVLTGMWEAAILGRGLHGIPVYCIGEPRVSTEMKTVRELVASMEANSTSDVMSDNKQRQTYTEI